MAHETDVLAALGQVSGDITYNGSGLDEFVPQRTAAYVSQARPAAHLLQSSMNFPGKICCTGVNFNITCSWCVVVNLKHIELMFPAIRVFCYPCL